MIVRQRMGALSIQQIQSMFNTPTPTPGFVTIAPVSFRVPVVEPEVPQKVLERRAAAIVPTPPPVPVVVTEAIPLSDPRHPQHAEWLAQQQEEESFLSRHGLWVGVGAAALVLGGVLILRRRN